MAMFKFSVKSVLAHKIRLLLTILAVVLGTAFVSGAMMFTNSLNKVFDSAVSSSFEGIDVVASGEDATAGRVPWDVVTQIADDPAVARVNVDADESVVIATEDKKAIQTGTGATKLRPWYGAADKVGEQVDILSGHAPTQPGELLVDSDSSKKLEITEGQKLIVVDERGQSLYTVVGTANSEQITSHGVDLFMDSQVFNEQYVGDGGPSTLLIAGADKHGEQLTQDLGESFPATNFETGQKLADEASQQIKQALSFVNYFLVAFGLIALLVGTFIISNTFAMIVAQRLKEFALMRALGVSRRQLTLSVVLESAIVGLVGSILGVGAGVGLVKIIQTVMVQLGMPFENGGTGLSVESALVPIILGTAVTVLSAWAPARKAGRVKPVEAMRMTESSSSVSLVGRTVTGAVIFLIGVAAALAGALVEGWSTKQAAISVGFGAFCIVVGVFLGSPALSVPVVGAIGRIVGAPFGNVGKLAATNSRRNPRRTATTAFALTLGMALVTSIGMLSATMKTSIDDMVSSEVKADFVLSGPRDGGITIPAEVPEVVRDTQGVDSMVAMGYTQATVGDKSAFELNVEGIPPITYTSDGDVSAAIDVANPVGDFDLSEPGKLIADEEFAAQRGWKLGDSLPVKSMTGEELATVELVGTYGPSQILGSMQMSSSTLSAVGKEQPSSLIVLMVSGTDPQLRENLEAAVSDFIVVQVQTAQEYAGEQASMINQMLYILYALLALSVIVAILGIVNTLALNVIERRQEIGMLRAIGTQRRQVRTMITIESVQIALYGAVIGMAIGLGLGSAFLKVMETQGIDSITVPWGQLGYLLLGSAIVGIVAAVWPAHRAAQTPPLEAIAD